MKSKRGAPEVHHDIKSRIIFEEPEGESMLGNTTNLARNRSYTGYKYDKVMREPALDGQLSKRAPSNGVDRAVVDPERMDRTSLTIEGIKKKYGFTSKPQAHLFDNQPVIAQPSQPKHDTPFKNLANTERFRDTGAKMSVDLGKPSIVDIKSKYQHKRPSFSGFIGHSANNENDNESIILDKYKVEREERKQQLEAKLFQQTSRRDQENKLFSTPINTSYQLSTENTIKKFPSSVANDDLTPNFSDQMKNRNNEWLQNLDRVQDKIRAVLQR